MKCKDVNIIDYIEGKVSNETKTHIEGCKNCRRESVRLKKFVNVVVPVYSVGKRLDDELEKDLQSRDLRKMKRLPDEIAQKVADIRERSLVARVKKVVGKSRANIEELVEGFLSPRMAAQPASPKDITKPKKSIKVTKENRTKKESKKKTT
jgi:ribosomal protein L12E/L44/L45/RPP1/RPP2